MPLSTAAPGFACDQIGVEANLADDRILGRRGERVGSWATSWAYSIELVCVREHADVKTEGWTRM